MADNNRQLPHCRHLSAGRPSVGEHLRTLGNRSFLGRNIASQDRYLDDDSTFANWTERRFKPNMSSPRPVPFYDTIDI